MKIFISIGQYDSLTVGPCILIHCLLRLKFCFKGFPILLFVVCSQSEDSVHTICWPLVTTIILSFDLCFPFFRLMISVSRAVGGPPIFPFPLHVFFFFFSSSELKCERTHDQLNSKDTTSRNCSLNFQIHSKWTFLGGEKNGSKYFGETFLDIH